MKNNTLGHFLGKSPFSIFDDFFLTEDKSFRKVSDYNIMQVSEDTTRLCLNVAGIPKDNIEITIKDDILSIKGEIKEEENSKYIYKGFTSKFYNSFQLPEGSEILEANVKEGILSIDIKEHKPKKEEPRKIDIK